MLFYFILIFFKAVREPNMEPPDSLQGITHHRADSGLEGTQCGTPRLPLGHYTPPWSPIRTRSTNSKVPVKYKP